MTAQGTDVIALVPVRAGSKGLPGKNTRSLAGVPLYLRAVLQALRCFPEVVLSTDIPEISQADLPPGCSLLARPPELAQDATTMAPVVAHAIDACQLQRKRIALLQATSPLRRDADIRGTLALHDTGLYDITFTVTEADASVLKYGTMDAGAFTALRDPKHCFSNRQSLPPVYRPNGAVYVFSAEDFTKTGDFPCNRMGAYEMTSDRSFDIDTETDFRTVESILNNESDGATR